jgi:Domain of unknown function (DUF4340)
VPEVLMKPKSKTILLLAIALLSASGLYIWDKNRTPTADSADSKSTGAALFAVQEADIDRIDIQSQSQSQNGRDGRVSLNRQPKGWQIEAPKPGPADDATVAFLLNLLATGRSERSLAVESSGLKQFGLDRPAATLTFRLKNQKTHELRLGAQTFNQSSVYAIVDAPKTDSKTTVVLLPTSFLNALSRPLSDWKAKSKGSAPAPSSSAPSSSAPLDSAPSNSAPSDSAPSNSAAPTVPSGTTAPVPKRP